MDFAVALPRVDRWKEPDGCGWYEWSDARSAGTQRALGRNGAKDSRRCAERLRELCLGLVFYSTTALLLWMFMPGLPLPEAPVQALEPFRIANSYGLFAVMTHERYEIEFQGTLDGKTWIAYPFRYKPQAIDKAPGIYAPYQPRFEWNLWFASLGPWQQSRFVVWTEERLLKNEPDVLALFASNPFASAPPREVRAIKYQYWFTDMRTKARDWKLVEARGSGAVRAGAGAGSGRQDRGA